MLSATNLLDRASRVEPQFRGVDLGKKVGTDYARQRRERSLIQQKAFSPQIRSWVEAYSQVGQRKLYLWKWCQYGVEITTLPCVLPEFRTDVCETKFLSGMVNVLLDDVADQQGDGELLFEMLKLTYGSTPQLDRFGEQERAYAEFTWTLWDEFWRHIERYPLYGSFRDLLQYDVKQLLNTIHYSHLVNHNLSLLNVTEHDLYSPHGMMLMCFSTLDLMCTPEFPCEELGKLREVIWHAEAMARIGNLITTWQREIADKDFTSGVFARAVSQGDIEIGELQSAAPQQIEATIRDGAHEEYFLEQWEYHRSCLQSMGEHIRSFDLAEYVAGLDRLLRTELGSRGLK